MHTSGVRCQSSLSTRSCDVMCELSHFLTSSCAHVHIAEILGASDAHHQRQMTTSEKLLTHALCPQIEWKGPKTTRQRSSSVSQWRSFRISPPANALCFHGLSISAFSSFWRFLRFTRKLGCETKRMGGLPRLTGIAQLGRTGSVTSSDRPPDVPTRDRLSPFCEGPKKEHTDPLNHVSVP
jgi:hypothetical protein